MDEVQVFKYISEQFGPGIGIIVVFLARDWLRDKRFQAIREEQKAHFTCRLHEIGQEGWLQQFVCRFDDERKKQLSEVRDKVILRKDD